MCPNVAGRLSTEVDTHGTLPYHSRVQWHPAITPRPLPQSWSSPSPPTIAHYNGTQHWHHVHCTLQWHQSAKVVRRPPPPIGSANPYSYRYLGKNRFPTPTQLRLTPHRRLHLLQGVSPASGTLKGKAWWCIDGAPGCWMTYMDDPHPYVEVGFLTLPWFPNSKLTSWGWVPLKNPSIYRVYI